MRIIEFPEPSEGVVRGQRVQFSGHTVTLARLQDQSFGRDMGALEAAEEIRRAVEQASDAKRLEISDAAWRLLARATAKPTTAQYLPDAAPLLLPYLRAICEAQDDGGSG